MPIRQPNVALQGGPLSGAVFHTTARSVLVPGENFDRPGEVARYRPTRRKDEDGLTVYTFRGWDGVVATIPMEG